MRTIEKGRNESECTLNIQFEGNRSDMLGHQEVHLQTIKEPDIRRSRCQSFKDKKCIVSESTLNNQFWGHRAPISYGHQEVYSLAVIVLNIAAEDANHWKIRINQYAHWVISFWGDRSDMQCHQKVYSRPRERQTQPQSMRIIEKKCNESECI